MTNDSLNSAIERSNFLARLLSRREDEALREQLEAFKAETAYDNLEDLGIATDAWRKIKQLEIDPKLVFAHPKVLAELPQTSLDYRGISLLSRKMVAKHAGSVERWENEPAKANVTSEKAKKVAHLYNVCVSSILVGSSDWTLGDGLRNIVATIGISADGTARNLIGQKAEEEIYQRLLKWVRENELIAEASNEATGLHRLKDGITMHFGSEPDISFIRGKVVEATIEIKGGRDPAGALERLGVVQKSFAATPTQCKNFLVAGVVTEEMKKRLGELRVEKTFLLDKILNEDVAWEDFAAEIFHYALRIQ